MTLANYPTWTERAVCASIGDDTFYPGKGGSVRQVKTICHDCPVRAQCLTQALDNHERWGVWGGLSERERRPLEHDAKKRADVFAELRGAA